MSEWPFDQPVNAAAVTVKEVTQRTKPIMMVCHYSDDHSWAFLTGGQFKMEEAELVAMHEIVELDPSVMQVADLPPGWSAERLSAQGSWRRFKDETI